MNATTLIVVWGALAVTGAVIGGVLTGVKNRDVSAWIAWCFLLPPLVLA